MSVQLSAQLSTQLQFIPFSKLQQKHYKKALERLFERLFEHLKPWRFTNRNKHSKPRQNRRYTSI